ncbi:FMN reductase [Trinickia caryophylli]|uniref:FMN reductase n=1 Tax=Trinickia caryophylli TaxID=28094 RepID=A0A1X7FUS0_TRICW|nr:FMN reductase [Trinickia caryophylli]PMS11912.1 FMN reductase [Trinickia caryophylli]TRX14012.1 FMN reductase [Trinickia caryophylli]WQE15609.1 FMN reductase [Trinickia caryophylli]SMF58508.1 FMN reductase [Trinickia caryophylli]GLU33630.1 FMN reductase [Trinickia caryophylli]
MSKRLNVVAVSGGLQRPSRTLSLVQGLLNALSDALPVDTHLIELGDVAPRIGAAQRRDQLAPDAQAQIKRIELADLLVVATPVYRGAYTGLFKHLFDFVHHEALIDVPVLLAATGGSERHALVIDHQLRPLFSFFQCRTLPLGVYASERDFDGYEIADPSLRARIDQAIARALPLLGLPRANTAGARAPLAA